MAAGWVEAPGLGWAGLGWAGRAQAGRALDGQASSGCSGGPGNLFGLPWGWTIARPPVAGPAVWCKVVQVGPVALDGHPSRSSRHHLCTWAASQPAEWRERGH